MGNNILELKKQYNKLILREKRAEEYFKNAPIEESEKYLPQFQELTRQLSGLMKLIPNMTDDEIINGFKDIE